MQQINTESDFLFAVSAALDQSDDEIVREIRRQISDWMEEGSLRAARMLLLDTVEGVILEARS
jgi:hypothetical protein